MPRKKKTNPKIQEQVQARVEPKADRQHFTYSENKLLDQITIKIMEGWKKDLTKMRKHYEEITEFAESAQHLTELIHDLTYEIKRSNYKYLWFLPWYKKCWIKFRCYTNRFWLWLKNER